VIVDPAAVAPALRTWDELSATMHECFACPLSRSRTRVVPGVFPASARLLLVGEAPGRSEDEGGLPFIGRSGQLLDSVLAEVGLERADLAVLNTVKCRPPDNRTPRQSEGATCRPWLEAQVDVIDPRVIVTLGSSALAWALGTGVRIGAVHGTEHAVRGRTLVPTYHPAAALRFGPNGAPLRALRTDLAVAASLLARPL